MTRPTTIKRDFDELEKRRLRAAALLNRGLTQAEVARRVKISRESVRRWWDQMAMQGGSSHVLRKAGRAGRKPRMQAAELAKLEAIEIVTEVPNVVGHTLWIPVHVFVRKTNAPSPHATPSRDRYACFSTEAFAII